MEKKTMYIGLGIICVVIALLLAFVGPPFTEITDYNSCVKMGGENMNDQCIAGSTIYSKLGSSVDLTNCESYFDGCNTCFVIDGKLGGCTLMACENYEAPKCLKEKQALIGGDRDAHGCIGSAGYVWSEERQECIRPWEQDEEKDALIGGDRDSHGCIGSAGYVWSEEAQSCIRPWEQESEKVGLANPASTNCINNGGELEIVDGKDGQYGLCKFDDGSVCEEWAFMRGNCTKGDAKIDLTNCESYFDGCNTCFVEDGIVGGCTRMYCSPEMMKEPKCLK